MHNTKTTIKQGVEVLDMSTMFPVSEDEVTFRCYKIYLFGDITKPTDFIAAIECMDKAEEGDVVKVYLSTNGGSVSAGDAFLFSMERAQKRGVTVHVIGSGLIASLGTWIILNASSYELGPGAHFLVHNGSMGDGGTLAEFKASSSFYISYIEKQMRNVYKYFLTEEEIEDVIKGMDMWMDVDEFCERYERRNELYKLEDDGESDGSGEEEVENCSSSCDCQ